MDSGGVGQADPAKTYLPDSQVSELPTTVKPLKAIAFVFYSTTLVKRPEKRANKCLQAAQVSCRFSDIRAGCCI
jgi:hypothetical protein